MRYIVIGLALLLTALFVGSRIFAVPLAEAAFKRAVEQNLGRDIVSDLPDGLHVALIGSGSPLGDPMRLGPSTAVIAGDRVFIVDSGSGTPRNLGRFGIAAGRIERVFLTHFHSDHIDGLGELMLQRWATGGHDTPLPVHGPLGVDRVVEGLNAAYALDTIYRIAHHGEDVVPPSGQGGDAQPFALASPLETVTVFDNDGLTVTAFAVVHDPVHPAVGYRFDYGGRSVVLSGDTAFSEQLTAQSEGVDLLVHEALNAEMVGVMEAALEARGQDRLAKIMADIPDYHATPVEAAKSAETAGVDMLVYSHLVPQLPTRALYPLFLKGVKDTYSGDVVLGEDGMMFSMPAGSDDIDKFRLD
ncbi:MAG: MBL fold metallo-hydrolase [Pseudomonadota bacterium]